MRVGREECLALEGKVVKTHPKYTSSVVVKRHTIDAAERSCLVKKGLRRCNICLEIKEFSEFSKANKHGYRSECRKCNNALGRDRYLRNASNFEVKTEGTKACTECKIEKPLIEFSNKVGSSDGRHSRCKKCCNADNVERRKTLNYPRLTEGIKVCSKCGVEKDVNAFPSNNNSLSGLNSWCKRCLLDYIHWRRKNDTDTMLSEKLRDRMNKALKGNYKSGSAVRDLGCSIEFFRKYLESMFYPHSETGEAMTWDNHGRFGWHLDHIKPLAKFNLADRDQFLRAAHYTNLQPLWAKENLKKRANVA